MALSGKKRIKSNNATIINSHLNSKCLDKLGQRKGGRDWQLDCCGYPGEIKIKPLASCTMTFMVRNGMCTFLLFYIIQYDTAVDMAVEATGDRLTCTQRTYS